MRVSPDYCFADIECFCGLSVRRGTGLAGLAREGTEPVRVVVGAFLLGVPEKADEAALIKAAERFLAQEADWLDETPEALVAKAIELGLMEKNGLTFDNDLRARPGVMRNRLIDELESARAILAERRRRVREKLQEKNRAVNQPTVAVDEAFDRRMMQEALQEARLAAEAGEVPVGAVLVKDEQIIARAGNRTRRDKDPSAHAEMLVMRQAARVLGNARLSGTTLYVTLEPCPMCAGGLVQARCRRLVFGAPDPRMGAAGGAFDLYSVPGINHKPHLTQGVLADEAAQLLKTFFVSRRANREAADE